MQAETNRNGLAGVGFLMSWIALYLCAAIMQHTTAGLAIVAAGAAVWAAFAIRFLIRKIRAGALKSPEFDLDFVLCAVFLGLTLLFVMMRLPIHPSQPGIFLLMVPLIVALLRSLIRAHPRA